MKDHYNTATKFWKSREEYPSYPNLAERRLIDIGYIISKVSSEKSVLDLGCGDGSILLCLREFTFIKIFYGCDINSELLRKLADRWGWNTNTDVLTINEDLTNLGELPVVDITLSLGSFPYIFDINDLKNILKAITSNVLIVRVPCTLKDKDEFINKFSKDLGDYYAAVYRTVSSYEKLFSKYFTVKEIIRAYPDEIESKYGTKHFFFYMKKK